MHGFKYIFPVYLVIFIGYIGYSLMITIFTPMIMHAHFMPIAADSSLGQRTIILGLLLCFYPLGQFLGSPVLGAISDHYGRKRVLMFSLCLTTLFYVGIAYSLMIHNLFLLMLCSFLAGLSEANVAIAQSTIADITTAENRSRLFGYIYIFASSAYVIGPLIGGKLADPSLISWFSYATPFWGVFIILVLTTIWIYFRFPETKKPVTGEKINYLAAFTNLLNIFTAQPIRKLYLINFLLYLSMFGFFRSYPMYLVNEFNMNVNTVSEYIAWVSVPIIFGNIWLNGVLTRTFSTKHLTLASAIFTGIFMISIGIPANQNALWFTLFFTALGIAICVPNSATLLSLATPEADQGKVMGNNASLQVGAEALSGIVSGFLAAIVVKLPLFILPILAFVAAGILLDFFQ